eukprot:gene7456-biopygen12686
MGMVASWQRRIFRWNLGAAPASHDFFFLYAEETLRVPQLRRAEEGGERGGHRPRGAPRRRAAVGRMGAAATPPVLRRFLRLPLCEFIGIELGWPQPPPWPFSNTWDFFP